MPVPTVKEALDHFVTNQWPRMLASARGDMRAPSSILSSSFTYRSCNSRWMAAMCVSAAFRARIILSKALYFENKVCAKQLLVRFQLRY